MTVIGIDPSLTSLGISDGKNHSTIGTEPRADDDRATGTWRRAQAIAHAVCVALNLMCKDDFDQLQVWIEAPMLSAHGTGANHLYELGFLMAYLYGGITTNFPGVVIHEVTRGELSKFITGKGNTPKAEMPLRVFKKYGVEFADDRGADKLFAYCLHRYGLAVAKGEVSHTPSAPRGKGQSEKRTQNKRAKAAA